MSILPLGPHLQFHGIPWPLGLMATTRWEDKPRDEELNLQIQFSSTPSLPLPGTV